MKNTLLKYIVRFFQRFIPQNQTTDRILIVSTTALGDTLWGTAALENLRITFPKSYIAILTGPIGEEIFKHNPHVDQIFTLKEPLTYHFYSLWKTLYQKRFDTILLFHASQRLTLPLCALLGASRIIGTSGINKGLDFLLTDPMANAYQHEIVRRCKIAERVGAKIKKETLSFYFAPNEVPPKRENGPWIILHPGSKDRFKRWPLEKFIELGQKLKGALPCEILITGTKEEKHLMEKIALQIPGSHIDDPNRSLRSFAALLKQIDLLISNDTGPVHLASALNTPLIAIYASTDPALCGTHKAPYAHIFAKRATCTPCLKRKCHEPFCFLQITPEEILQRALKIL